MHSPVPCVRASIERVRFEDVNESLDRLASGDFVGRAVIVYNAK